MADWLLAARNLLRNRRRSISTLLALAIGLIAILLFGGFKANLSATMMTAFVRSGGHLQVQHRDYFLFGSGNPAAYGIAGYADLMQKIREDALLKPLLNVVTPMVRLGGLAGNFDAGISRTVIGTGLEATDIGKMRQWNEYQVPGERKSFALQGTAPDAAIVGIGVARVLQLCAPLGVTGCIIPERRQEKLEAPQARIPEDVASLALVENSGSASGIKPGTARIELLSSGARGAPNVAALSVVAAEDQGFKELDEVSVVLHLDYAQKLIHGREQPKATALMVQTRRSTDRQEVAARIRELIASDSISRGLVVLDFEELNPFYAQSERLFDVIFGFIFVLIGGIALFTVGNTMSAAVVERTVEIGTLRAIGLRQSGVRKLFVIEGLMLGILGGVSGIVLAVGIAELVNRSGMTWLPPGNSESLPLQISVLADRSMLVCAALGLVAVATVSAWWPAWRAARLNVVEALRHA